MLSTVACVWPREKQISDNGELMNVSHKVLLGVLFSVQIWISWGWGGWDPEMYVWIPVKIILEIKWIV